MNPKIKLRSAAVEWREIEGEIVALDLRKQVYLGVNRTGAAVWTSLAEGATRDELVEIVVERFDVTRESAGADIDAFLAQLEEQELLDQAT